MPDLVHEVHPGDCLAPTTGMPALPDGSVSHVITDPPYDPKTHRAGALPRGKELGFDALSAEQMLALAREFKRLVQRWVIVFCSAEMAGDWSRCLAGAGLDYVRTGAWVKTDAAPQLTGDRPSAGFEALVIAHQPGRKRWNGGGKAAIWRGPAQERLGQRVHPTQKPLWLLEALLRDFTDAGELILDPFMGSGTTGVAARRLGRASLGWEQDARHLREAARRIEGTREQLEIGAAIARPAQEALL